MVNDHLVELGKVIGVHGLHGNLKIHSYSREMDSFRIGASVYISDKSGSMGEFSISSSRRHKKGLLLLLKGIDHINVAETYVGSELFMRKTDLPELDEDTDYWIDLIGLEVFDMKETLIGVLESIIETGSNDVYVVRKHSGKEVLVPALKPVIKSVDLDSGTMIVDLPEGL